jgi:hypothetical protein
MNDFNEIQEAPMSVKDWVITLIVTALPMIGFIMLFVWGFGGNAPTNKANWAKAALLLYAIGIVLAIAFYGTILGFVLASGNY